MGPGNSQVDKALRCKREHISGDKKTGAWLVQLALRGSPNHMLLPPQEGTKEE